MGACGTKKTGIFILNRRRKVYGMAKVKCEVSFSGEPSNIVRAWKSLWYNSNVGTMEARRIFKKRLPKGETVTVQTESKKKAVELVIALRKQGLLATYKAIR